MHIIMKWIKKYLNQPIFCLVIIFILTNCLTHIYFKTGISSKTISGFQKIQQPILCFKRPVLTPFVRYSNITIKEKIPTNVVDKSTLVVIPSTLSYSVSPLEEIIFYKVKRGDTLSGIAKRFNLNLSTIKWANPSLRSSFIREGMKIVILPTDGVLHQFKEGETLESVASLYDVSSKKIKQYNPNFDKIIQPPYGYLIIPNGQPIKKRERLPNLGKYFSPPASGWNWGILRNYNGVDISNQCGTKIKAAAEGLVVEVEKGYNMGYGNYIKIEHPNKTFTLYAHLSKILVKKGEYVKRGQVIGLMGDTGHTTISGCYVHFEVHGAKNPFVKY